jgi:hypothetical protein
MVRYKDIFLAIAFQLCFRVRYEKGPGTLGWFEDRQGKQVFLVGIQVFLVGLQCAESKYGLRIQFLTLVVMIYEVWLNA